MRLRTRAVVAFNMVILAVMVCAAVMLYVTASHGFDAALEMKAHGDVHQAMEILDTRYPGGWHVQYNILYKGSTKITGNYEVVDTLKMLNGDHVTIFLGDTRVTTSFVNDDGSRPVNTKASADVIKQVLIKQKEYVGYAEVLDNQYLCSYTPIYAHDVDPVGMVFVGIPTEKVEVVQNSFLRVAAATLVALVIVVAAVAWMAINWMLHDEFVTPQDQLYHMEEKGS